MPPPYDSEVIHRVLNDITLQVASTDGDTTATRRTPFKDACWHEGVAAEWLADVLGLANIAKLYAPARALFMAVEARQAFTVDELNSALDVVSDALMDDALPFDEPQRAFSVSSLLRSPEALHSMCVHVYELLAAMWSDTSLAYEIASIDADFFDQRRIYVPGTEDGAGSPATSESSNRN